MTTKRHLAWLRYSTSLNQAHFVKNITFLRYPIGRIFRWVVLYSIKPKQKLLNLSSSHLTLNKKVPTGTIPASTSSICLLAPAQVSNLDNTISRITHLLPQHTLFGFFSRSFLDSRLVILHPTRSSIALNLYRKFLVLITLIPSLLKELIPVLFLISLHPEFRSRTSRLLKTWLLHLFYRTTYSQLLRTIPSPTDLSWFIAFASYGAEDFVYAIRRANCTLTELLHSHIHIDHFGYNTLLHEEPPHTNYLVPNKYIGHPRYSHFFHKGTYISTPQSATQWVDSPFSSDHHILIGQADSIDPILRYLSLHPDQHFIFKPHPRDTSDFISYILTRYNISISYDPVKNLIIQASHIVSPLSSLLLELLDTNTTVTVLSSRHSLKRYLFPTPIPRHFTYEQ